MELPVLPLKAGLKKITEEGAKMSELQLHPLRKTICSCASVSKSYKGHQYKFLRHLAVNKLTLIEKTFSRQLASYNSDHI